MKGSVEAAYIQGFLYRCKLVNLNNQRYTVGKFTMFPPQILAKIEPNSLIIDYNKHVKTTDTYLFTRNTVMERSIYV